MHIVRLTTASDLHIGRLGPLMLRRVASCCIMCSCCLVVLRRVYLELFFACRNSGGWTYRRVDE